MKYYPSTNNICLNSFHKKIKLLLTLLIVLFYNSSCSFSKFDLEKHKKSELVKQNIKGKVKKMVETGIFAKGGLNKINHVTITIYDNKGNSIKKTFAHKNDNLKETKIIFEFDKKGNKVRENRLDLKGKLESYLVFEYDSSGNVIKESYFLSNGRLDTYTIYKHNSTFDIIESKIFYSNGVVWLWYKNIHKDGNLIEIIDQEDSTSSKFIYDNQNNNIKYIEYDKFGVEQKVYTYLYEFDIQSNWTKKTLYEDNEIYWIDERQYEYYH